MKRHLMVPAVLLLASLAASVSAAAPPTVVDIGILIGTELMLNGAGLNFMAFNKFLAPDPATGQITEEHVYVLPEQKIMMTLTPATDRGTAISSAKTRFMNWSPGLVLIQPELLIQISSC